MPLTRALTVFVPVHSWRAEEIVDRTIALAERVFSCAERVDLNAWTNRVVLPVIPPAALDCNNIVRIAIEVESVLKDEGVLIAFPLDPGHKCLRKAEALLTLENAYFSTACSSAECLQKVSEAVYSSRDVELDAFTRFAISFGTWLETPYFPATANTSNTIGFSLSLRYVDAIAKAVVGGGEKLFEFLRGVTKKAEYIASCSSIPFQGIDFSISPWVNSEESVALLIESLLKAPLGSLGTLNILYNLNALVKALPKKVGAKHTGFNEVMLPVAEDSVLSQRIKEGYVRVRDLIGYSFVCVAGLDMVALPREADIPMLAGDMLTVYRVKGRVVAMRIIPTDMEEGGEVRLKNFGTTYVAKV